ncbi:MAG TPA: response regulator transcription factor [Anaerolineae bacterium]|nr:response regulator transcription factor [Anaerolineae bacterium]
MDRPEIDPDSDPMSDSVLASASNASLIAHILVVDDELAMRESLREILELEGFQVSLADNGEAALDILGDTSIDLMLLDLKMKGMDGLETTEAAKNLSPETVIIMLTAHGTLESAIAAMRYGAFDYLLKPAAVGDIIASVQRGLAHRAQMMRQRDLVGLMQRAITELQPATVALSNKGTERHLKLREIDLDLQRHIATVRGRVLDLTLTEFRMLVYLMERPDQVISPHELVGAVQGYQADEHEARAIVRVHIRRLRQKIESDPDQPDYVLNVRGVGYVFASEKAA